MLQVQMCSCNHNNYYVLASLDGLAQWLNIGDGCKKVANSSLSRDDPSPWLLSARHLNLNFPRGNVLLMGVLYVTLVFLKSFLINIWWVGGFLKPGSVSFYTEWQGMLFNIIYFLIEMWLNIGSQTLSPCSCDRFRFESDPFFQSYF